MSNLVQQAARFATVGVLNTLIGVAAIYAFMFFAGASPAVANALGYGIGLCFSFLLHRTLTFNSERKVIRALPPFLLAATVCYLLNLGAVLGWLFLLPAQPYFAQLVGVGVYTLTMFLACRWFVFASTRPQPEITPTH
jgi:putative flippase GtrA